jgi:uncharacterized protein (DUF1684 family)
MAKRTDRYEAEILAWRAKREADLRTPDGWLSLVGLRWLHHGENRLPGLPGRFLVERDQVRLVAGGDEQVLRDDIAGDPTVVESGSLSFHLIRRGERLGIRVRDREARTRREFRGLEYFPIDPKWRVTARFEPSDTRTIDVPNVLGDVEREPSPGSVDFTVDGVVCRLDALAGDEGGLWLVFGDATNDMETYAGGRFLKTDAPSGDGSVVIDFNRAYNPPCVFTPYATCPLPPPQNRLSVPIWAGERGYVPPR